MAIKKIAYLKDVNGLRIYKGVESCPVQIKSENIKGTLRVTNEVFIRINPLKLQSIEISDKLSDFDETEEKQG